MEKIISVLIGIIAVLKSSFNSDASKVGIKETKEMIIGANILTLVLIEKFKDGVQFADFTEMYGELVNDEAVKKAMQDAYENYSVIPEEISDIDALEGLELAEIQLPYINELVNALKKEVN